MASTGNYAATPKTGIVAISTGNTFRDGTGTLGNVLTASGSGSRIDAINIQAVTSTSSGMIRLFIHNGTTAFLLSEIPVVAVTPSSTSPAWSVQLNSQNSLNFPIILGSGFSLRASTNNAETFNVITTQAGDF